MELAPQMATDLMLLHARSITDREVLNAFEDYTECPDLGTPEADALVKQVLGLVETADIDVTVAGA